VRSAMMMSRKALGIQTNQRTNELVAAKTRLISFIGDSKRVIGVALSGRSKCFDGAGYILDSG